MAEEGAPLVSVVLPTLNGSRYIVNSIESIRQQTYPHWELLVVDGGSTDHTLDLVGGIGDPRITHLRQPDNAGRLPGALNVGFAQARGSLYTWAQDDDLYSPDAFEALVDGLRRHPQAGLVYAGFVFVDDDGQVIREATLGPPDEIYHTNVVGHCFMYRREVAEKVGAYDPAYYLSEDFHYWARVYKVAPLVRLPGCYYQHRLHRDSLTMRRYTRYEALRVAARARRTVLGLGLNQYRRQLAAAYIEEGFAAYQRGDRPHVRRCVLRGLLLSPRWLLNRGVPSILAQSLLP